MKHRTAGDGSLRRLIRTRSERTGKAEIAVPVRILAKDGRIVSSRLFQEDRKLTRLDPPTAVAAFNDAFESIATELISWTTEALQDTAKKG